MSAPLPAPVAAYFDGNARFDAGAMLAPFAEDALVSDEHRIHRGRDAIRAWIAQATIGSRALAEPQSTAVQGDDLVVVARVSGPFPGSPILLDFRFTLADGHIAVLEIS